MPPGWPSRPDGTPRTRSDPSSPLAGYEFQAPQKCPRLTCHITFVRAVRAPLRALSAQIMLPVGHKHPPARSGMPRSVSRDRWLRQKSVPTWTKMAREECGSREASLGLSGRLEPLHLPLSPSPRTVRVLGLIIQISAVPVIHVGKHFRLRDGITPHPVGHDPPVGQTASPSEAAGSSAWRHRHHAGPEQECRAQHHPDRQRARDSAARPFAVGLRRRRPRPGNKWHMDEVVVPNPGGICRKVGFWYFGHRSGCMARTHYKHATQR
jgi:hypothetical protein